jgi:hypothetical protein
MNRSNHRYGSKPDLPDQRSLNLSVTSLCLGALLLVASCTKSTAPAVTGGYLDSMNIARLFSKSHPNLFAVLPGGPGKDIVMPTIAEPASVLDSMIWLYQAKYEFPIPNWKRPDLGWATGYEMDTADYPALLAQGSNVKTIGFHFGIRNYQDVLKFDSTPIFTMAIIPVDRNSNAMPAMRLNPNTEGGGGGGGFDFVQPCPGSPGCPTN